MTATVAIVGRPNVGKSTLFNRLAQRRLALVDDTPGVTRDWREGEGALGDLRFRILDTAGLEDAEAESLASRMRVQTEHALERADAVLFLIDARAGVTPVDRHFAQWLRRRGIATVLVANKTESKLDGNPAVLQLCRYQLPVPLLSPVRAGIHPLHFRADINGTLSCHDGGRNPRRNAL